MKRSVGVLLFLLTGCSTAPLADFLDFVKPGKLSPEKTTPYGGVCAPHPGGPALGGTPPSLPPPGTSPLGVPPPPVPVGTPAPAPPPPSGLVPPPPSPRVTAEAAPVIGTPTSAPTPTQWHRFEQGK